MNQKDNICREGIVRDVKDNYVLVEVIVSSACSGCHAKSVCIPSERREEKIWALNPGNDVFSIGETVNLTLETSAGNKAVVLAYVVPLVILLIILFSLFAITHNELLSIGTSVMAVFVYYLILKTFNKKLEQEITFCVSKKS